MQVVRKLLSLSETVAAELDKEPNASALVDVLLGEFFEVEVMEAGKGGPAREEAKSRLNLAPALALDNLNTAAGAEQTVVAVPVTVPEPAPAATEETVISPVAEPVAEVSAEEQAAEDAWDSGEPLVEEVAPEPEVALSTEAQPVVEEVPVVEALTEVATEPVDTPPAVSEVPVTEPEAPLDVPINIDGQPGGVCEIHGLFVGPLCIDCL